VTEDLFTKRDVRNIESIVKHCGTIEEAVQLFGSEVEDFIDNVHFQNDCFFALSQIGEIVKRLSSELKANYSNVDWSDIAKLRDIIAHNYESIELLVIWGIITEEVSPLKEKCERILKEKKSKW